MAYFQPIENPPALDLLPQKPAPGLDNISKLSNLPSDWVQHICISQKRGHLVWIFWCDCLLYFSCKNPSGFSSLARIELVSKIVNWVCNFGHLSTEWCLLAEVAQDVCHNANEWAGGGSGTFNWQNFREKSRERETKLMIVMTMTVGGWRLLIIQGSKQFHYYTISNPYNSMAI